MPEQVSEFTIIRRVAFTETDAAGMVHFAQFFCYMEDCEHQFLCSLGEPVFVQALGAKQGWPRVQAACTYRRPAQFNDVLSVKLLVTKIGTSSIQYQFQVRRQGEDQLIAVGQMTAVYVHGIDGDDDCVATPQPQAFPEQLRQRIIAAPATSIIV